MPRNKISGLDFYCAEVLTGKTSVKKVYESDTVLAFHHTKPSYKFHVVIVPKKHIKDLLALTDADNDLVLEIIRVARDILAQNQEVLPLGVRLVTNQGKFADTSHLHFHLVVGEKTR